MRSSSLKGVAAVALVGMALTACSGSSNSPQQPADDVDLQSITILAPTFAEAPAKDGELHKAIEKFSDKTLDITWLPRADYDEKFNVTLAGDDLPELMVVQAKTPLFVQSAQAGAFWDLTDLVDSGEYPNLKTQSEQVRINSSVNGRVYGLYRWREPVRASITIRKDWLENLGLSAPKTLDELYTVAKAFTEQDPDGNGQPDTYGIEGIHTDEAFLPTFEVWSGAPNEWSFEGGEMKPAFDSPKWLEAQRYLRKLYSEGLINETFATGDPAKYLEDFKNGKAGMLVAASSAPQAVVEALGAGDPTAGYEKLELLPTPAAPDGKTYPYPTPGYAGFIAIPKSSVTSEAELKDILTFLDKMSSKEGQILQSNGIEGTNFTVVDGGASYLAGQEVITQNATQSFTQIGTNNNGLLSYPNAPGSDAEAAYWEVRRGLYDEAKTAVVNPAQPYVSNTYTTQGAQLDQIIADARIKFMVGQIDEAALLAEIERWHTSGGDTVAQELTELAANR